MKKLLCLGILVSAYFLVLGQDAIKKANECYDKQDWACALDQYTQALNANLYKPEEKYLLEFRVGYCYGKSKQLKDALSHYLSSIALREDYLYPWWNAGDIYYNSKRYDSSVICYLKAAALATKPEDKDKMNFYLGEAYFNQKKYAPAVAAFNKVGSRSDGYENTDAYVAEALYMDGKYQEAAVEINKAHSCLKPGHSRYKAMMLVHSRIMNKTARYDSARFYAQQALAADPNYGSAFWEMGLISVNQKNFGEAVDWFKKALPKYEKDTANLRILYNNIVVNATKTGDYTTAVAYQQRLVPIATMEMEAYSKLAILQLGKLKQPAVAEKTITDALRKWDALNASQKTYDLNLGAKAKLLAMKGLCRLRAKDSTGAESLFRQAMLIRKYQFESNFAMGDMAWARKQNDSFKVFYSAPTLLDYDTLLYTSKDIGRFYGRRAYAKAILSGSKYFQTDVEAALQKDSLQKEAISLWPDALNHASKLKANAVACANLLTKGIAAYSSDKKYCSDLYFKRGIVNANRSDTLACRKDLEQALKLDKQNWNAWENLMKYYSDRQNESGGQMVAENLIKELTALKDKQRLAVAYIFKGDFLWRQNKKEEARAAYGEALVWDPSNKDAKSRSTMQ